MVGGEARDGGAYVSVGELGRGIDGAGEEDLAERAEVAHLAGSDQFGDGAGDVLDRYLGVDAMLVEQVEGIDTQAAQGGVGDTGDLLGAAVEADGLPAFNAPPELGRDHNLIAQRGEGFPDEFFVDVGPPVVRSGSRWRTARR